MRSITRAGFSFDWIVGASRWSALLAGVCASLFLESHVHAQQTADTMNANLTVHLDQPAKDISTDLFGIFFEDINYSADGGLYAELIQNRSFEYSAVDSLEWTQSSFWKVATTGGAKGWMSIQDAAPIHPNNRHYATLSCDNMGNNGEVALANTGFDGIPVKAGQVYDFSVFAHRRPNERGPLFARLESANGESLAVADIPELTTGWKRYTATLTASKDDANARLVVGSKVRGMIYLDEISLFPHNSFKNRPNGLRADLAQKIADIKPRFVRFPGGCLAHGDGLENIYRWKNTIGPIEQRKAQKNIWRYHQTGGLGYFEYFQFCEDIGAAPLPVLAAGVSCQNSDLTRGTGQQCVPMDQMQAYVQDVLDLIEYANGPVDSKWGAMRAAAGHAEPFHLKYVGIGNEDEITSGFTERFKMIFDAVKTKYPEITVVGTVGPAPAGRDFDAGWKIANELSVPVVDEHYYMPPEWFLNNLHRYDNYDRSKSKVYLGEYASHGNTLYNALSEAAYMGSLERNGDVVHLASYAPLLAKYGHTQWNPDLIYFNNTDVFPTVNYYIQQMYSSNMGDKYIPSELKTPELEKGESVSVSSVLDSKTGEVILKLVNVSNKTAKTNIEITGAAKIDPTATTILLTGDPTAMNDVKNPKAVIPKTSELKVGNMFTYEAPPNSCTVIRLKTNK